MNEKQIIKQVKEIILKHANPARIYLYGSQETGEADQTSDIDIAYEDDKFQDNSLIESEVEQLETLKKIDVKNIAHTEDRFRNRVKSTGKVLYSKNKRLRAEDGLWNFSKAFERYGDVVDRRKEFYEQGFSDIYLDVVVKRFEFTYEMSWKAIKRYLDYIGIDCKNPRHCFKEAYAQGLITDESIWLDMIESRNLSSHVYDEQEMSYILEKLQAYKNAFGILKESLEKEVKGE